MPEYTVATVGACLLVVLGEVLWARTGIFRRGQYWLAMAIVFAFQVLVDGWLTKLSDPIVLYAPRQMLGVRFPLDIPIEDFGFGFALVTAVLVLWERAKRRAGAPQRPGTAKQALRQVESHPEAGTETPLDGRFRPEGPENVIEGRLSPGHGTVKHHHDAGEQRHETKEAR